MAERVYRDDAVPPTDDPGGGAAADPTTRSGGRHAARDDTGLDIGLDTVQPGYSHLSDRRDRGGRDAFGDLSLDTFDWRLSDRAEVRPDQRGSDPDRHRYAVDYGDADPDLALDQLDADPEYDDPDHDAAESFYAEVDVGYDDEPWPAEPRFATDPRQPDFSDDPSVQDATATDFDAWLRTISDRREAAAEVADHYAYSDRRTLLDLTFSDADPTHYTDGTPDPLDRSTPWLDEGPRQPSFDDRLAEALRADRTPDAVPEVSEWFGSDRRPTDLVLTRNYDQAGGLARTRDRDVVELEREIPKNADYTPQTFPDLERGWVQKVNGDGPASSLFRRNNCLDCALAGISTWHGEPKVAAPRSPEYNEEGMPLKTGERGGVERAQQWLGHDFSYVGEGTDAYSELEKRLLDGGHGSSALIMHSWMDGGSHTWNAFNQNGKIVWVDFQDGQVSDRPVHATIDRLWTIAIDRKGDAL